MSTSKRVTLSDIAERLNLTKVSISKALRDHPDISEKTKELVKKTAHEMGYAPNRLARSLTLDRTGTLGVIIPKISHNFFADALDGINEVALQNDYEIVLCVSEENDELEARHLRTLLSMQVDGLLVSISEDTTSPDAFINMQKQGLPLVFFDRSIDGIEASHVTVDDRGGAYAAVSHAIENGCERIAHVAGFSHIGIGRDRRLGYEEALRDHGFEVDDDLIVEGGFSEKHGYHGCKELLQRGAAPDAIFAVTFPVALGIDDAIRETDPSLYEEITIYSFGQHGLNRFFKHPHVSVCQPARELGEKATSVLIEEIENPELEPRDIVLSTHVVETEEMYELPYLTDEVSQPSVKT